MEEMRADGVKDLEITFIGMAFVIQGALRVITSAIQTINKIEKVSCIWIIMVLNLYYNNLYSSILQLIVNKYIFGVLLFSHGK